VDIAQSLIQWSYACRICCQAQTRLRERISVLWPNPHTHSTTLSGQNISHTISAW